MTEIFDNIRRIFFFIKKINALNIQHQQNVIELSYVLLNS